MAQRTIYLAAGEALSQVSSATPQTFGFLLMAAAGMIMSFVVLRSEAPGRPFGKAAAYVGIVGFVAALVNYVSRLLAPEFAAMIMSSTVCSGSRGGSWSALAFSALPGAPRERATASGEKL